MISHPIRGCHVSDKAICPACDSYTSDIHEAFRSGDKCPYCGLPAKAANAVLAAQERGASEDLVQRAAKAEQRAAKAEQRAAKAEREVLWLRDRLDQIGRISLDQQMGETW
jgi:hypothetical protein